MELWLMPQLEDSDNMFFSEDTAPPHFHCNVTQFLNKCLPGRQTGRHAPIVWSPDLTVLISFLRNVLRRLSTELARKGLKILITQNSKSRYPWIRWHTNAHVWNENDYHFDTDNHVWGSQWNQVSDNQKYDSSFSHPMNFIIVCTYF
jgi:hypothetical protein